MKKRVLLFLLILSIFCSCFCACGDTPDTPDMPFELGDQCFYFFGGNNRNLVRGDITTRRSSIPCPDPLCDHGENCPVGKVAKINAVTEKRIYFSRNTPGSAYRFNGDLYCYDLENGTVEMLISTHQIAPMFGFVGENAYFAASEVIFTEEGSVDRVLWDIYRYDPNAKQLQKLTQESLPEPYHLQRTKETQEGIRLIWEGAEGTSYIETDEIFQNLRKTERPALDIFNGYQYVLTSSFLEDGNVSFKMEQLNVKTQERKLVADRITSSLRMYRETPESEPTGLLCQFLDEPDCYRRVYLIHFSDLSREVFIELPSEYAISVGTYHYDRLQIGPYLAFKCGKPKEGKEFGSWSLYVVDLRTREGFFITK